MWFFSPLNRLAKVNSALFIGVMLLVSTSLGLLGPHSLKIGVLNITFIIRDVFFSWWYLGLEILLATSLFSCSFLDQLFVLKCHMNTNNKLTRTKLHVYHYLYKEIGQLRKFKKRLCQVSGMNTNMIHKGILRYWTPLAVHLLSTTILTYGAVDILYAFQQSAYIKVGNGLFLSSSGSLQTSLSYIKPHAYCRINDVWYFTDPYQPFVDISILDMEGQECHRFSLTNSSSSSIADRMTGGRLSLISLTPRQIRVTDGSNYWELPTLAISKGTSSASWVAYGLQEELMAGWGEGQMILSSVPAPHQVPAKWEQQDAYEDFRFSITKAKLVDLMSEANIAWSNNDLSLNVFLVPLFAILGSLVVSSRDIMLDYRSIKRP